MKEGEKKKKGERLKKKGRVDRQEIEVIGGEEEMRKSSISQNNYNFTVNKRVVCVVFSY